MKCENCTCTYESCSCYSEGSECAYENNLKELDKEKADTSK